ncbi:hypothetical protein sscle_08g063540 [Sclerotinia sclerotiorum 1980 UF-70]|uniref:Uncharacterized protein n=1 Tax=Sclerotinia sclerotiorum (strain ATCC 18683 / 1980 / Ss-1) TaxID=665079 RepID=A0A1D9Q9G4_SCLS1|nr:hypothetical protein sscle_08g063540 [Sclerotinia sclerotiorum 1980 UF-70]
MICNFLWEHGLYEAFTSTDDTTGIQAHRGGALMALAYAMSYTGGINLACWGVVMWRARNKKTDLEWQATFPRGIELQRKAPRPNVNNYASLDQTYNVVYQQSAHITSPPTFWPFPTLPLQYAFYQ